MLSQLKIDHHLFGRIAFLPDNALDDFGDLVELNPVPYRQRTIPATLFYSRSVLPNAVAQTVEKLADLALRLNALDSEVRHRIPASLQTNWCSDRLNPDYFGSSEQYESVCAELSRILPSAADQIAVRSGEFSDALKLEKICFSLDPAGSGGAALSMDYRILPVELDAEIICATFDLEGQLVSIHTES